MTDDTPHFFHQVWKIEYMEPIRFFDLEPIFSPAPSLQPLSAQPQQVTSAEGGALSCMLVAPAVAIMLWLLCVWRSPPPRLQAFVPPEAASIQKKDAVDV